MLRIRAEQMAVLAELNLRRFVAANLRRLREAAPGQTQSLPDEELLELAIEAAHEGARFGIQQAGQLRRYLQVDLLLGHGFASRPEHRELAEVLRDPGLGPDTKLECLDDSLAFRS